MQGATEIGEECYVSDNELTIHWRGELYYRACGFPVRSIGDYGGYTYCTKRKGHPSYIHEDFEGKFRHDPLPEPGKNVHPRATRNK